MTTRAALTLILLLAAVAVPALPAAAESVCVEDPAGDVSGSDGSADDALVDILAACADLTEDTLEVSVRTAQPVPPPEAWDGVRGAIGFSIDTNGDGAENRNINLAAYEGGDFVYRAFEGTTPMCDGRALYDGARYRATLPLSCLGDDVTELGLAAYLVYEASPDDDTGQLSDQVPPFPDYLGPISTEPDPDTDVVRLEGPSRVETSLAVSQDSYLDLGAETALLARADQFPDALAGAPLAVAQNGPVLLTQPDELRDDVAEELQRILPEGATVHLLGGTSALSEEIDEAVADLGFEPVRVEGDTRYATAVAIAEATTDAPTVAFLADGNDFPAALVAGSAAGHEQGVVLLTDGEELGADAAGWLDANPDVPAVAVGEVAAEAVADRPEVEVIAGADPFATAVLVAEQRYPDRQGVALASGTAFPDGLTGGAHAARLDLPLLLSWPDLLPGPVATYLDAEPLSSAVIYGGVAALPYPVEAAVAERLEGAEEPSS